ncbi:MAG: glutaminyl-peptide cyclotransferase [Candidatus Omnitrophota bacterium]
MMMMKGPSGAFKITLLIIMVFGLSGFTMAENYGEIKSKTVAKIKIPKWYHEGLYFDGRDIWVNNGKRGDTWVVNTNTGKILRKIKPEGSFTEAITPKDKDTFFVTDWDAKKVYISKIENDKMYKLSERSVEPAHPAGAVWNGVNLFVVTWTRSLMGTRFHILKMDADMNILSMAEIAKILEPAHLAWDGNHIWISCWYSNRIYKVDIEKLEMLGYLRSPAKKTTGIAWDGKYLWVTGTYDGLYKMELLN